MYQKSIQAFFRKKTTYLHLAIIIIALAISIITFCIKDYIGNWIELQMEGKDYLKTMVLNAMNEEKQKQIDEAAKEIEKIKYVEEVRKKYLNNISEEHYMYLVTVDNWKHIDYVKKQVDDMGYILGGGKDAFEIQINSAQYIQKFASFANLFLNILTTIILLLFNINLLKDEKADNMVLKAIGYTNGEIWKIMLVKITIFVIIAYILSQMIALLLAPIIDTLLFNYGIENYKAYMLNNWNIKPFAYVSLIIFTLGIILYLQINKIKYISDRT